ncbi:hypothetical protein [Sphaerotilus uruguayifluvii]|uniref:Uncharacterized protein n=1 Tax=Sphaerotilus uruguayifluvii TaxID=2735897 RepID=A0ABX2FYT5_9BURK|nr:hypothetical protein [Leptothrix sp. C29]NRT55183.1 hypothetical protein [Leptothrix sp. C29]
MRERRKTPCCPHLRNPVAPNRHTSGTPATLPDHAPCGLLLALGTDHHSTRRQALDLDQLSTGQASSASASTCSRPGLPAPWHSRSEADAQRTARPGQRPCGPLLALGTGHHSTRRQALDLDQPGTGRQQRQRLDVPTAGPAGPVARPQPG